jgi:4-diphosphocytidyl-2-C-methyl-D-erythritol kinase
MTRAWTVWPAPAKLNLFLHIVGRRADGYHVLQTVFQLLDWGDEVHLRARADGAVLRSNDLAGVPSASDLAMRAALLLREHTRTTAGVDIRIDKRIPLGGGLGGGSSDAASVLVALNELWQTGLSIETLAALGLTLGADVPVFVHGHSAWAEGIGEILTPITLPQRWYVVVDPRIGVPTAPLFQAPELTRNAPPATISGYLSGFETNNVFAPVVRDRYPQVAAALDWLSQFGDARLSGSGGCVFVAVASKEEADAIMHACPREFSAYCSKGVNQSPLLDAVSTFRQRTMRTGDA